MKHGSDKRRGTGSITPGPSHRSSMAKHKGMVNMNHEKAWEEMLSEYLTDDGMDISLMTGLDLQRFELYCKLRKELSDKYPKPKHLMEDEEDTLDIGLARDDPKAQLFQRALFATHASHERVGILQHMATEYEKKVIRIYANTTRSWHEAPAKLREVFQDSDIYEMVESYFKILRKYGLTTTEEPYYFLSPKRRREVKIEGEMLKRNTQLDDSEIKVSLLEESQ